MTHIDHSFVSLLQFWPFICVTSHILPFVCLTIPFLPFVCHTWYLIYVFICHVIVYWILYVTLPKQPFSYESLSLILLFIYHTYFDYLFHLSHIFRLPHLLVTHTRRAHPIFPKFMITMPSLPRRHEFHPLAALFPISRPVCFPIPIHLFLMDC